jgi:hypothetical protein
MEIPERVPEKNATVEKEGNIHVKICLGYLAEV